MKYNFFISYKRCLYLEEAKKLKDILEKKNYSVWIDLDHPVENMSNDELAHHIEKSLYSCQYIIFFETYGQVLKQINGPSIRDESWQEFELRKSIKTRLMVLYDSKKLVSFGESRETRVYENLDQAVNFIINYIQGTTPGETRQNDQKF